MAKSGPERETVDQNQESADSSAVADLVDGIKQRAISLVNFAIALAGICEVPMGPVFDAIDAYINHISLGINKIRTADHESGHLLLDILNGQEVSLAWITPHGRFLTLLLGLPGGIVGWGSSSLIEVSELVGNFKGMIKPSEFNNIDSKKLKLTDTQIVAQAFMMLAGDVSMISVGNKYSDGGKEMKDMIGDFGGPSYFGRPGDSAILKRMLGSSKYGDVLDQAFALLLKKTMEFFEDPLVKEIVDIFSLELLEKHKLHANGESINEEMLDLLEQKGISREDFEKLERKYFQIVGETVVEMRGLLE